MEPAAQSGAADGAVAAVGRAGLVARPALVGRLTGAGRVTVVSAPAGSGKTVLLRSWIAAAGLAGCVAWVPVRGAVRDPQRFWISVADALRGTGAGAGVVRPLTVAPDLDGWAVVERLLEDLSRLPGRIWLVVDDLHELGCEQTLAQLTQLVLRAPAQVRVVLASRHELGPGLHRLRLAGELTEIRAGDLRLSFGEARALFDAAGVELAELAVALLVERTEGWAAGLRLAALSLARHPDPERFAAEFCGSDRMVAEYLLAEVLQRQPEPVRRLLLRTSVLARVNGELADLLTGEVGGERVLQDLEAAGGFVVALDTRRSWFRYHQLFADLLQLELRRAAPGLLAGLHGAAAGWFAGHGDPVQAIRHAQAGRDWELAAGLLCEHWVGLVLAGRGGTAREFLAGFPAGLAADPELAAVRAADELDRGSLTAAGRYLALAGRGAASVPAARRGRWEEMLAVLRLQLARQGGDLPARADTIVARLDPADRDSPEMRIVMAAPRLAQDNPHAATTVLVPILRDPARLADCGAAPAHAFPVEVAPGPEVAGATGCPDPGGPPPGPSALGLAPAERLTDSETRVLRFLPTHLTAPEIADELYVSVSTVKTHMSHLYAKLGSHRRTEAVDRARALGLLAPTSRPAEGYAVRRHEASRRRWPATAVVST